MFTVVFSSCGSQWKKFKKLCRTTWYSFDSVLATACGQKMWCAYMYMQKHVMLCICFSFVILFYFICVLCVFFSSLSQNLEFHAVFDEIHFMHRANLVILFLLWLNRRCPGGFFLYSIVKLLFFTPSVFCLLN